METGFFEISGIRTSNIPELFSNSSLDNSIIIADDIQTVQDKDLCLLQTASAINSNISVDDMDDSDVEIVENVQNNYISAKRKRGLLEKIPGSSSKKKCGVDEYRFKELEQKNLKLLDQESSSETDEDLMFFRSLLPDLKTLTRSRKMCLKLNIQDMLYQEVCANEAEHLPYTYTPINQWLPNQNGQSTTSTTYHSID